MGFNTKNTEIPEGSGKVYKGINGGAHVLTIMDIDIFKASTGNKVINLQVEDTNKVEEGYTYKGLLGEHTAAHNFTTLAMGSWFAEELTTKSQEEIQRNLASLANGTGTREQVDAVTADTVEDYVLKVLQIIKGKPFCTIIQEREYLNSNNEVKTGKNIKTMKAGENYIVLAKPYPEYKVVNNVITNDTGSWTMAFMPEFDVKKIATPDADPNTGITTAPTNAINDPLPF